MKNRVDFFFIVVIFLMGTFHTITTLLYRRPIDLDFWMYVGTGLTFLLTAGINIPNIKQSTQSVTIYSCIANALVCIYLLFIGLEIADARAFIVIFALLWLLISSLIDLKLTKIN